MEEKMHPYLAPLYDELAYYVEKKHLMAWMEHGLIEIVPLSLMRGRTFNNSFVILDEAQNALMSELRMCLTRIGMNSKMVITGDLSQSDLYPEEQGGLERCVSRLNGIKGISVVGLTAEDIVRNPLIGEIESALLGNASCYRARNDKRT
jgi:phosphate starvation-inducible PhoH-like protein